MKNAILFDLGNVIVTISVNRIFEKWSELLGLDYSEIRNNFKFDETFDLYEKGLISTDEYIKHVSDILGYKMSQDDFLLGWNSIFIEVPDYVDEMLIKLKGKYKLYALSNTNSAHYNYWINKYDKELSNLNRIFCSHQIKMRKPEREIYEYVMSSINEKPENILFLDDNEENINRAIFLGIESILIKTQKQMIDDLKKIGIY